MVSSPSQMSGGGPAEQGSVTGLLTRVMDEAMALVRNELALVKAEARGALQDMKQSIGPFAVAAGVLLAGALTLVAALVLALTEVMRPWLAALIVAVALMIVGGLLLKAGQRKWARIGGKLDRTQESLQKDATLVARRT